MNENDEKSCELEAFHVFTYFLTYPSLWGHASLQLVAVSIFHIRTLSFSFEKASRDVWATSSTQVDDERQLQVLPSKDLQGILQCI